MRYYFAPMEGLTDHCYRQLHHQFFPGVDCYFTPFLSPTVHRCLTDRAQRELPLASSIDYALIPQALTRVPADFLWLAQQCFDRGYRQINLNLGCPSGTVTAKGKGAGMLADPDALDRFLDAIFSGCPLPISIKTRIGICQPDEFYALLEIFNRYPVAQLIIHPRLRSQFYGGVHMEAFSYALSHSSNPVCYNGDLCSRSQITSFSRKFPQVESVMIGRGLIGNPGMLTPGVTTNSTLAVFMDALLEAYTALFGSTRNAMFRLKENWQYLLPHFPGSEKLGKQLRKTTDVEQYRQITHAIFSTLPYRETPPSSSEKE